MFVMRAHCKMFISSIRSNNQVTCQSNSFARKNTLQSNTTDKFDSRRDNISTGSFIVANKHYLIQDDDNERLFDL